MFAKVVLLSALVSSAFATVFITSPTNATTYQGGQTSTIQWLDDGVSPTLDKWGPCRIGIWTGNANQQTMLQQVSGSFDVSSNNSINFTPDPSIGPNGEEYFIRIESLALKDAKNTQYPQMSFSSLFNLASMTGTFNATVQAQINGQTTAPIGGSIIGSTASQTASQTSSSKPASASTTSASKNASTTAAASTNSNDAMGSPITNVWISAAFGAFVLALML